ncbi:hypothetical protein KCTCHS21_49430 [Cohnella abietis]|uniref:Uncharacterized protein n=1 Tax=Cohnella abietis TaxID=2507935 RepID=A0A3T1DBX7_9BACL|nr:hypothetical protein KCTCHS21_49430 [Cohnella abietis]
MGRTRLAKINATIKIGGDRMSNHKVRPTSMKKKYTIAAMKIVSDSIIVLMIHAME